jgi:hypothetical protein
VGQDKIERRKISGICASVPTLKAAIVSENKTSIAIMITEKGSAGCA